MKLMSIVTTTGAFGAVMLPLLTNIPPTRAADSIGVRGTIVSVDGSMLTVKTREGATTAVALKDGWKLTGLAKALPDDIKAGELVGIASTPTTAAGDHSIEVLIFPPVLDGASEGAYAWVLGTQDVMTAWVLGTQDVVTSATVSYAVKNPDGRTLTVSYHGLESRIAIAEGTPVVTFAGASRTELTAGTSVFIPAERSAGGALTAGFVIVGANGVVPPM